MNEQVKEVLFLFNQAKPIPGKVIIISDHRKCDFCQASAIIDGKTNNGIWANMCLAHYLKHGIGIGIGKGQVIIWKSSV